MSSKLSHAPVLVMIRGIPGSGKSRLVTVTSEIMPTHKFVVLDPDAIDYNGEDYKSFCNSLRADSVDEKLYPYRYLRQKAYGGLLEGKIVVWNQAFTNQDILDRTIKNLIQYGSNHGVNDISVIVVEVEIDPDVAKFRLDERRRSGGHVVTEDAMARFVKDYSTFSAYGYEILTVYGSDDILVSSQKLADRIFKLSKF